MSRKPKFKPEVTRVKLNPEQAVLLCTCYDQRKKYNPTTGHDHHPDGSMNTCSGVKTRPYMIDTAYFYDDNSPEAGS